MSHLPRITACALALAAPYTGEGMLAPGADPYAFIAANFDDVEKRLALEARCVSQLAEFEGFSATVYIDTTGHATIGYGHKLSAEYVAHAPIDREAAYRLLWDDVMAARKGATVVFPQFDTLPAPAQEALIHMAFQLGTTGLSRFTNLKKAIRLGNYNLAAVECIHSKWCRTTPVRARFCSTLFGSIK